MKSLLLLATRAGIAVNFSLTRVSLAGFPPPAWIAGERFSLPNAAPWLALLLLRRAGLLRRALRAPAAAGSRLAFDPAIAMLGTRDAATTFSPV